MSKLCFLTYNFGAFFNRLFIFYFFLQVYNAGTTLCIKSNFFCFIPLAFKAEITDLCAKFKCLYSFIVIYKEKHLFWKRKDFYVFFSFFLLFSKLPLQRQFTEQQKFTLKIYWKIALTTGTYRIKKVASIHYWRLNY